MRHTRRIRIVWIVLAFIGPIVSLWLMVAGGEILSGPRFRGCEIYFNDSDSEFHFRNSYDSVGGAKPFRFRLSTEDRTPRTGKYMLLAVDGGRFHYQQVVVDIERKDSEQVVVTVASLGGKAEIPAWPVALVCLLPTCGLVAAAVRSHLRHQHRVARGLCLNCGYDLRGLPGPRCPECGKPIC